jgi:hypothetical protein
VKHILQINEFLNTTIDIDKTANYIQKKYNKYIDDCYDDNNGLHIYYKYTNLTYDIIKQINKELDVFGWFPAMYGSEYNFYLDKYDDIEVEEHIKTSRYKYNTIIRYEAKFNNKIIKKPYFLYHLTPDIYYEYIMKKGLLPKNKNKISIHPNRIYLLNYCASSDMQEIVYALYNTLSDDVKKKIEYYYVLEIDVENLKNDFYNDPNFHMGDGAVWTNNNIPPSHIKFFDKIKISRK